MRRSPYWPAWSSIALLLSLPTVSQGYELLIHGIAPVAGESVDASRSLIGCGGLPVSGLSSNESLEEIAGLLFPTSEATSDLAEGIALPAMTQFRGATPNPFRLQTTVHFEIGSTSEHDAPTRFEIFDVTGRSVRLLVNDRLSPGRYSFFWDGTDRENQPVSSGVYFGRFSSGDVTRTVRLIPTK